MRVSRAIVPSALLLAALLALAALAAACHKVEPPKVDVPMVRVPAGRFMMGSPDKEPSREADETAHEVTIERPFYLGVTEVTQAQWRAVMGANPSYFKECGDSCPVEQVSWYDSLEFCNKLSKLQGLDPCYTIVAVDVSWNRDCRGYRLPTENEWEYAARAGTVSAYANGEITPPGDKLRCEPNPQLDEIAWYCGNSAASYPGCVNAKGAGGPECGGVHPVGQKQPNAWGLYDTAGNVFEWVWDVYGFYPTDSAHAENYGGSGWRRVSRGGAWYAYGAFCRSALRNHDSPGAKGNGLGLRLARSAFDQPAGAAAPK